jgi:DNA-binding transcriptional regulator YdaS (Cro superfamily)
VTVDELLEIFGTRKEIARILGLHVSSVYQWGNKVPPLRVYQIKEILRKQA